MGSPSLFSLSSQLFYIIDFVDQKLFLNTPYVHFFLLLWVFVVTGGDGEHRSSGTDDLEGRVVKEKKDLRRSPVSEDNRSLCLFDVLSTKVLGVVVSIGPSILKVGSSG